MICKLCSPSLLDGSTLIFNIFIKICFLIDIIISCYILNDFLNIIFMTMEFFSLE